MTCSICAATTAAVLYLFQNPFKVFRSRTSVPEADSGLPSLTLKRREALYLKYVPLKRRGALYLTLAYPPSPSNVGRLYT